MRIATIDELSVLAERIVTETENLPEEQKRKHVIDEVYEILVLAYIFGVDRVQTQDIEGLEEAVRRSQTASDGSEEVRTENVPYEAEKLYNALYRSVGGENFEERIARRIREGTLDRETLKRILETDYHRMEETGAYDRAKAYAEESGRTPYKVWQTMRDDRVRETHWYIEDTEVPVDDRFYTFDGDSARFPGDFELVENNANCRCWLRYTFR